jgi:(4S)-4-hydroxy-5-phosphonooxypentane-2,3-dione isomerase
VFVVIVDFEIVPAHAAAFARAMHENAAASVRDAPGCLQFDVCVDPKQPHHTFLYEVYADADAFAAHLKTPHFHTFNDLTAPWIVAKHVRTLTRTHPSGAAAP